MEYQSVRQDIKVDAASSVRNFDNSVSFNDQHANTDERSEARGPGWRKYK